MLVVGLRCLVVLLAEKVVVWVQKLEVSKSHYPVVSPEE